MCALFRKDQSEIRQVHDLCMHRGGKLHYGHYYRLLTTELNTWNTKVILFSSRFNHSEPQNHARWQPEDKTVSAAGYRGLQLDWASFLKPFVMTTPAIRCHHLRRLLQLRRPVGTEIVTCHVLPTVLTWLDYCNAHLLGLPESMTASLQRVQDAALWLVFQHHPRTIFSSNRRCCTSRELSTAKHPQRLPQDKSLCTSIT